MTSARVLLLLFVATTIAGCGRGSDARLRLAGSWAPQGQTCDSAGGIAYDKAGAWAGYNVGGRWTLDGDTLTTRITERGGFDRPARIVAGEKPVRSTVLSLKPDELVLRQADGSTVRLVRCRK